MLNTDLKHELTPSPLVNSTPLVAKNYSSAQLATVPLNVSIELTRVTMVSNLISMSNTLLREFDLSNDLRTKLIISGKIQEIYREINNISKKLQQRQNQDKIIDLSPAQAPYLDYVKPKARSLTWVDYCQWCKKHGVERLNKGQFFTIIANSGFKQSMVNGYPTFKPPGVR